MRYGKLVGRGEALVAVALLLWLLPGCGGGGAKVKCYTDNDCPLGQHCVGGACVLPGDQGVRTCATKQDCYTGEFCDNGVCKPETEEPQPDGGDDGGVVPDGDGQADAGSDPAGDPGGDPGSKDYSYLNFTVAVSRGGTTGPATQCVTGVRPVKNQGGSLQAVTVVGGYTVTGTVKDSGGAAVGGAQVSLLGTTPECYPAPVKADGSGKYTFYLPGSAAYDLQAVASTGPVAHAHIASLAGNTNLDLSLPAASDWHGGPLTDSNNNNINGWTVMAYYRTGTYAGLLAHAGVKSGPTPAGEFTLSVPTTEHYDLIGFGAAGDAHPLQILWPDANPLGQPLGSQLLKTGVDLTGQVKLASGMGAPASLLTVVNHSDPRLAFNPTAGTNGNYQVTVRPDSFDLNVFPSVAALDGGATMYSNPNFSLFQTKTLDITLGQGEAVVFAGKVVDGQGVGVSGAQVKLLVNQVPLTAGSYATCSQQAVTTDPNGGFQVTCSVLPQ